MKNLPMGANASLAATQVVLKASLPAPIDITVLQIYADGKVRGDADMCFFGQTEISGGAVRLSATPSLATIQVQLGKIPEDVAKLVVTATLDEAGRVFGSVSGLTVVAEGEAALDVPLAGRTEAALILCELYRRDGAWKIRNVCQGFNGGLAELARHFGVEVAEEAPKAAPPAPRGVSLEKKLVSLEKRAPELVSLVKKAGVSLAKNKVSAPRAKLALVLDISGSMSGLYNSGKVDSLVRRVMALGYAMDDDGDIDVFLFGVKVHDFGAVTVDTYKQTVARILRAHRLESGTRYGDAIARVREHYSRKNPEGLPVFVMFVTDGGTDDKAKTERELRAASHEPLFWKFMAIQEGGGRWDKQRFEFLNKLDELSGRLVDNADAFSLADPGAPSDEEMFDLMMNEYQDWLVAARKAGVLAAA